MNKGPYFLLDPMYTFLNPDGMPREMEGIEEVGKPFIIPGFFLVLGGIMVLVRKIATAGKLVLYFGAQSFMNVYMSWLMRSYVTAHRGTFELDGRTVTLTRDLKGCPAGLALTVLQQAMSFLACLVFLGSVACTPFRHAPKKLSSCREMIPVFVFSLTFVLSIGLNNFSLGYSYVSLPLNLIFRSCLPLLTIIVQSAMALCGQYSGGLCRAKEVLLIVIGVICAIVFTLAKVMATGSGDFSLEKVLEGGGKESSDILLGVASCVGSVLCGSLNLVLAGNLGDAGMKAIDIVAYMAIPAVVFLVPGACLHPKKVHGEWRLVFGQDTMTDFEILVATSKLDPVLIMWLCLSGIFTFAFSIIQISLVHALSPAYIASGCNFNKAALALFGLVLPYLGVDALQGVHVLPGSPYIYLIWVAVSVGILAFICYSILRSNCCRIRIKFPCGAAKKQEEADVEKSSEQLQREEEDRREKEELARMAPDDRARHILRSGALRLLSANWLIRQGDSFIIRRMQDLPPDAFLSPEKAAELFNVKWAVIVISYGWLSRRHPDPRGFHMRNVQRYLKKHKKFVSWLPEYGVFWDFASLPQDGPNGKTAEEKRMFKKGLGAINLLYGAMFTIVIQLTRMPSAVEMMAYGADGNATPYYTRGWCFFEATVSAILKDSFYLMDIGLAAEPLGNLDGDWHHFMKTAICDRPPPLIPSEMANELRSRKFTNGADMEMVSNKYDEFFQECARTTADLHFNNNSKGKGWNDDKARKLARALPHFERLNGLGLGTHHAMGEAGLAELRKAFASLKHLNHLIIPKHLENTGQGKALKDEWLKSGKRLLKSQKERGGLLFG